MPHVTYFFGFPRSIEPGGVEMDLARVSTVTSVDGKGHDQQVNFVFQLGALSSALEHAIPEQMFVTPDHPGEAISAVKALSKAAAQGQRIYHITPANQYDVLPNIHHNEQTMNEIRAALATGKEVITHTDAVSVPGWSGAGYLIYDPHTGDGAWKIGGGMNGSFIPKKLQFFAGLWKWFQKTRPVLAKALTGSIGLIAGFIATTVNLLVSCNSIAAAIAVSVILLMWNLVFLGVSVLLVSSGVGTAALWMLSILEWYLQNKFTDKVKTMC